MFNIQEFKTATNHIIEWLQKEYTTISVGRANPVLLDSTIVESYGTQQPIKNIASITVEDPRTLRISPWDKSMIDPIQKAIQASGLPFALGVDGEGIRASMPQLTEENKKTIVKLIKEKHEEARVRLRTERQKAMKNIDDGEYSDDEKKTHTDALQKIVDDTNAKFDAMVATKESDVMTV